MQVALVFAEPEMWRQALDGEYGLRQQIARRITSDYLWYEQSFGYNSYVVRAVLNLFTTAGLYGRTGELAAEMGIAENLMLSPIYLRFPDGRAPNPADNASPPLRVPDRSTLAAAYRVFPTTLGLEAAAGTHSWDTLLDPALASAVVRPAKPAARTSRQAEGLPAGDGNALPPVVSRNLESSRMAVLKSGGWQVFFHYGQLTRSHAQAEPLNFAAFFRNADITHDPGTVGYGSPLHLQGRPRLPAGFAPDPGFAAKRPAAFGYWRNVERATFQNRVEFDVDCSGSVLRVTLEGPGEFTLWHGSAPDIPPRRRDSFLLELNAPATSATFTTRFEPQR